MSSPSRPPSSQSSVPDAGAPGPHAPRIWLLLSEKLGDNAQVKTVAAALGLDCQEKTLAFKPRYAKIRPSFKAGLGHVDLARSGDLVAPWPDLILTSGRRPALVALWIKQQAARAKAGPRTRIVIVGRPHRQLADFDLVIAPPQFSLPARPNILPITWPLFAVAPAAIAAEAAAWAPAFADLPRPLTAILLGGPQPPFRFNAAVALDILEKTASQADNGSLVILASRRTPIAVARALAQALPPNARLFPWSEDKNANPYRAILGLADRFVVTGDSISMIGEVLSLGKPLAIATAPLRRQPHILLEQAVARRFRAALPRGRGLWSRLKRHVHGKGVLPFARDFAGFHGDLVRRGAAVFLGSPFPQAVTPASSDLSLVAARIRALLVEGSASVDGARR